MSTSTRAPAAPLGSATKESGDQQHRCGSCGALGLRTVALICSKQECRDLILDDMAAPGADLRAEAARAHTCPHCGTLGDPIEMIECPGCANPVRMDDEAEDPEVASGPAVGAIVAGNEGGQDVSVTRDKQPPAGERAAATQASDDAKQLLKVAPEVFRWAAAASGVSAVVAGEIEREELYRAEGFSSFREYAEEKLGISSNSAFKKLRQAARAVWEFYPDLAGAVLNALQADGHARVHELPKVPDQTKLYLLGRAHANTAADQQRRLLGEVLDGTCKTRQLEQLARRDRAAQLAQDTAQRGNCQGTGVPMREQAQPTSVTASTPPTQGKVPTVQAEVPPSPTPPSRSGSARDASASRAADLPGADEPDVNGQDLVSQAFWGLDTALSALHQLKRGEIKTDRQQCLRDLAARVQRALDAHEESIDG